MACRSESIAACVALVGAIMAPSLSLASDPGTRIIDPGGAAMPHDGGCQPQIVISVPDFPEAEHVSASTVSVNLEGSQICVQAASDPKTFRTWFEGFQRFWGFSNPEPNPNPDLQLEP